MSLFDTIKQHLFGRSTENTSVAAPSSPVESSATEVHIAVSNTHSDSVATEVLPEKTESISSETTPLPSHDNSHVEQETMPENTSVFLLQPYIADLETLLSDQPEWYEYVEQLMRQKQYQQLENSEGDCFSLCEWLKKTHTELHDFAEYKNLTEEYQNFKQCTKNTLAAHQQGNFAEAIQLLRNDLLNHDEQVCLALKALLDKIRQEYAKICQFDEPPPT